MSDTPEPLSAILAEMRRENRPYGISPERLRSYADRIDAAVELETEFLRVKVESEKRWACEYFTLARRREDALLHCKQYAQKIERENEEGETRLDAEEIIATVDNEFAGIRPEHTSGNAAATREALKESTALLAVVRGDEYEENITRQIDRNTDALSAPARNCDVGTPEEQFERFRAFCKSGRQWDDEDYCSSEFPLDKSGGGCEMGCTFHWAQMPFTPAEGGDHA